MPGIIICDEKERRQVLVELVGRLNREGSFPFQVFESFAEASNMAAESVRRVTCIYYVARVLQDPPGGNAVVNDTNQMRVDLMRLSDLFPRARVLVELPKDLPEDAFFALRAGAYNVLAADSPLLFAWEEITKAIDGDEIVYPLLMATPLSPEMWGFISMTFNPGDRNHNDWRLAISPTMRKLGLKLRRNDQTGPQQSTELLPQIRRDIDDHEVLVALISSLTPNTMFEIGYAYAQDKPILWLRRNRPDDETDDNLDSDQKDLPWKSIPSVLRPFKRLQYSTMIELSMKLFFGLGGCRADLNELVS